MSAAVRVHEPLGERAATLPLALGAEGADVLIPGSATVELTLEQRGAQWQAQPAAGAAVLLNGLPLLEPALLDAGDVIGIGHAQVIVQPARGEIEVRHLAGNATVAPLRQDSLPGDEIIAGVREIFATGSGSDAMATSRAAAATRGTRWLVLATLAVLLAIGALLLVLVPVPLQLQPATMAVQASSAINWHAGDRIFVLPGERTLTFSAAGYRSQSLTVKVSRALASAQPLPVALVKLPDRYAIDTAGIAAALLLDGSEVAQLPGEVEIDAGAHEIIVRAPKYVDHVERLEIVGGGSSHQLKVRLQPATGWLVVDTQPTGARISIDGREQGSAPLRVELDAGLRRLAIAAPGRRGWNSEVAIVAGQTLDLGHINLALPPPARIDAPATADAAQAAASLDSIEAAGPTPPAPRPQPPARLASPLLGTLVLMPAGKYLQGSERREQGRRNNEVQREVTLTRAFYLAENEVTNAQFRAFKADHVSGIAMEKSLDLDRQPVSNVGWSDAVEFCNWLSLRESLPAAYERRDGRWQLIVPLNRGYRLPTEAEWEYAARYVDGQHWQRYAWGDALPPPPGAANLGGTESLPPRQTTDARLASSLPDYRDEHPIAAPVGSYARSAAGFYDLAGNVSEWMHDVYISLPDNQPVSDPMGATSDGPHAIRGANWRTATIAELRSAWREQASAPSQTLGFRVARFAEDPP
ncbi:MAG: SUMF1/EgtB/PvdO family nonheme iron enzyme [Pseudomonadota bacterium]